MEPVTKLSSEKPADFWIQGGLRGDGNGNGDGDGDGDGGDHEDEGNDEGSLLGSDVSSNSSIEDTGGISAIEQFLQWCENQARNANLPKSTRLDYGSFVALYNAGLLQQHHGRYILFRNGNVYPKSYKHINQIPEEAANYSSIYLPVHRPHCSNLLNCTRSVCDAARPNAGPTVIATFVAHTPAVAQMWPAQAAVPATNQAIESRLLGDTGADSTSLPVVAGEIINIVQQPRGHQEVHFAAVPFFGPLESNKHPCVLHVERTVVNTAGGSVAGQEVYFKPGQMEMKLPGHNAVPVTNLSMPTELVATVRPGQSVTPPQQSVKLLGRDLALKHFSLGFHRLINTGGKIRMSVTEREEHSPTEAPHTPIMDALDEIALEAGHAVAALGSQVAGLWASATGQTGAL